ncbi:FecR domain-containing protein [Draconibacterium sp. IB214405]|uniref:FecR family protein n=1 Tax=Draconibacterium sp. IB214405 TaxID=3097352 RepID=UPI002A152420|nr:FecR domain-containing protein [Draconibacterium sp. IB214405]MDX8339373.1 FecR domain-containing protein [Draconibacterium sp. IB214405]
MKKELLNKYLNGNCSAQEFEEFSEWVKEESLTKDGKDLGLADWVSFNPSLENTDDKKYSRLLDKIHHKINLKEHQVEKGKTISFADVTRWFSRAAAILFLPLLGVLLYLMTNNNIQSYLTAEAGVDTLEVIAPIGSRTVVQLTDGTEVNLNYGSRIKYPREFRGNTREIKLIGEGYFDVAHDSEKPFIVNTGKLNIKVLGTEFNVQAYPENQHVATTLVNGKVSLEEQGHDGEPKSLGAMQPGQHVDYNISSGEMESTSGNIDKYIAWKDGKLVFDNEPIKGVASKLSRMFNVDIFVAEELTDLSYTVTFIDEPLFFILDLMTETTPITYTVSSRNKLPDGTYTKQQINIQKRQ